MVITVNIVNFSKYFGISLVTISLSLLVPASSVEASDSRNASFVTDGKSRSLDVYFVDRAPAKICADRTVSGKIRLSYVATKSTLTVNRIEIFNGSKTQQVSVSATMRVGKNRVLEGITLVYPSGDTTSSIKPNSWATIYDAGSKKVFRATAMLWTVGPQFSLFLEKSDPTGGMFCNGQWLLGFLKRS